MGRKRKLEPLDMELLIADRVRGMTPQELEAKYKLGKNTIYDILKYKDVALKIREGRLVSVRDKLYERTQGVTVQTGTDRQGDPIYKDHPPDVPAIRLFLEYEEGWNPAKKLELGENLAELIANIRANNEG